MKIPNLSFFLFCRMENIVFGACLLAVSTITSGQNNVDITPREVLSEMNRIHKDFPNTMVKPILIELENRPSLLTDVKNKNLELRAAHGTNSNINLNPITMSSGTGSMQISHTANSEFQIKPQTSNGEYFQQPEIQQNPEVSSQTKIYLVNVPSETTQRKDIATNINVIETPSRSLQMKGILRNSNLHVNEVHQPFSAPEVQLVSAAQVDNQPQTILYAKTANQPQLITSISSASDAITPQVVHRSIKDTFTLTDQQAQLFHQPVNVNLITNPRRGVLLRQTAQVVNLQILQPQRILYAKPANQHRLITSILSKSDDIKPQVAQRSLRGTFTLTHQRPQLVPQSVNANSIANARRVVLLRRLMRTRPNGIALYQRNRIPVFVSNN